MDDKLYTTLKSSLDDMNKTLVNILRINEGNSTNPSKKKTIPYNTESIPVGQLNTKPSNPDDYPTKINLYIVNNKVIPHMTLINDGPGDVYFVAAYENNQISDSEGHLNVNDQRELFNVYEIRLRSDLPQTTFRLTEGVFRTGSFAPQTKANTEIRPTLQANEKIKEFGILMDKRILPVPPDPFGKIPITPPLSVVYSNVAFIDPIAAGVTYQLFDLETALPMPYIVPAGCVLESFVILWNFTVNSTLRIYFQPHPPLPIYNLNFTIPISARLLPNLVLNANIISTRLVDPFGAPPTGRGVLLTVTNDDSSAVMVGELYILMILRQLN